MSNSAIPRAFVKNPLHNGMGRYICQLQRITLNFCKSSPASLGMRDFIETYMLNFTRANPGVVVYVKPRRHKGPNLTAEYLNGRREVIRTASMPADEICKWLEHLRTRSGVQIVNLSKMWQTHTPSIQGVWHPFLNKDPSLGVTAFPAPGLYRARADKKSASEMVLEESAMKQLGTVDEMTKE